MHKNQIQAITHKHMWRKANIRLLPSLLLCIIGAAMSSANGRVRTGSFDHKLLALVGVMIFITFATTFLQILTKTISRLITFYELSAGRVAAIQFVLRLLGYVAIGLITLDLLGIPVGKLLLGGAAVGIILGVAAQQALANFFASIVLIISHPFSVGEHVTITSGGLGGKYVGQIKEIGLTHTHLQDESGNRILLPNSALLSGATIMAE